MALLQVINGYTFYIPLFFIYFGNITSASTSARHNHVALNFMELEQLCAKRECMKLSTNLSQEYKCNGGAWNAQCTEGERIK
jgi:hypothetical protein